MTPRRRLVLRSPSNHDLILNAVAAGFVMEQDELVFALCVSHTAQAYGSNCPLIGLHAARVARYSASRLKLCDRWAWVSVALLSAVVGITTGLWCGTG